MKLNINSVLLSMIAIIFYHAQAPAATPKNNAQPARVARAFQWTPEHEEIWFRTQQAIVYPEDLTKFQHAMQLSRAYKSSLHWQALEPVYQHTIAQWAQQTNFAYNQKFSKQHPQQWQSLIALLDTDNSHCEEETQSFLQKTFKEEEQ